MMGFIFCKSTLRWDIRSIDVLPDYMKLLYRAIIDVYNEIEEHTAKEGRSYCVHYAKEAVSHFLNFFSFKYT